MLEKLTDLTVDTGTTVIRPVKYVRDLGIHLDSELTMKTHVSQVFSSCYYQLRRIRQVRQLVGQDVAQLPVSAFIYYVDLTTATHCCLVCRGKPFSVCIV